MKKFVIAIVMTLMIAVNAFSVETYKFKDYTLFSASLEAFGLNEDTGIDDMLEMNMTEFYYDKGSILINPPVDKGSLMDKAFNILGDNNTTAVCYLNDNTLFVWYWYKGNQIQITSKE